MKIGAVLMAAGAGSRMGHQPKCLLHLDGVPLITRMLENLRQVGVSEIIVVLGHYHERIEPYVKGPLAKVVLNTQPDEGQVSSQRLGLGALEMHHDAIVMALADQPLLEAQDLETLLERFKVRQMDSEMLFPQVHQAPANPVIISPKVQSDILRQGATYGCRQWRAANPERVERLLSDNTHFSCDLDTPEDMMELMRVTGRSLTWEPPKG
jgi:molybdenum cofactor cytidylyltransferase